MIIALYIVAFAMVGGGLAALVQGMPYIMVERGWAMVIAGTVAASSGALLAGIAVAASRLGRILDEVANLREWAAQIDMPAPATEAEPSADYSASPGNGNPGPAMPTADLGALAASLEAVSPKNERVAETDDKPPGSEPAADTPALDLKADPAARFGATETPGEPPREAAPITSIEERRSQDAKRAGISAGEASVIGTYSSGGNSYIMYSDGSIQADTPNGMFRFKSLDELKDFIAAGGESEGAARGA